MEHHPLLFDQYEHYPSELANGWYEFFSYRYEKDKGNTDLIRVSPSNKGIIVNILDSKWDFEHFGFKVAKVINPIVFEGCDFSLALEAVREVVTACKKLRAKVVVARVNGDNLDFIHAFESSGFRFYENIIWPVVDLEQVRLESRGVSFFDPSKDDLDSVKRIASASQYERGHYYCDRRFEKTSVDSLYSKWVQTAYDSGKKITVIKQQNNIAGYFISDIDKQLGKFMGVSYGRLQALALDSAYRGKGLGAKLFEGTLYWLREHGCRYVDSGYASRNHLSARLHTNFEFMNVYEEVTMHRWLSA